MINRNTHLENASVAAIYQVTEYETNKPIFLIEPIYVLIDCIDKPIFASRKKKRKKN